MNSFYSILYVPIRPGVHELLTLGLLMRADDEVYFKYSKTKLRVLKALLSKDAYHLMKISLNTFERSVERMQDYCEEHLDLVDSDTFVINEQYINYLSVYSKNLVTFTKPELIGGSFTINEEFHKKLYLKFIGDDYEETKKEAVNGAKLVKRIRTDLIPRIKDYVSVNKELTPQIIPHLIVPSMAIDFMGKNEIDVTGQAVNFSKKESFLEADITKQVALRSAILKENTAATSYIIGKEPEKKLYPQQHQLWDLMRKDSGLEFVDADEFEKVEEYMQAHGVKPIDE